MAKEEPIVRTSVHEKYALPHSLSLDSVDGNPQGDTLFTRIVNVNMIGTKLVERAAIFGTRNQIYAASEGLTVKPEEMQALVVGVSDPTTLAKGVDFGEVHYDYQSASPGVIHAKNRKSDHQFMLVSAKHILLAAVFKQCTADDAKDMLIELQGYFRDQNL